MRSFGDLPGDVRFRPAVREMRAKLEAAEPREKSFKTSPGGIYDIDFLAAFLLSSTASDDKNSSLRDRLWRCAAAGVLEKSDAAILDHAAELLRTVEHEVRVAVGRARRWLPATEHARHVTERLVSEILGRDFPEGLEQEVLRTCAAVRQIFDRVLPDATPSGDAST